MYEELVEFACWKYEIYKDTNTLRKYCQVSRLNHEKSVLKGEKRLVVITVAKAVFGADGTRQGVLTIAATTISST